MPIKCWNEERTAHLEQNYSSPRTVDQILWELNQIPGLYPVSSAQAVRDQAKKMGLVRGAEAQAARLQRAREATGYANNWTPERRALLRELWATDTSPEEVVARINALPGPTISYDGCRTLARRMGVQRPETRAPRPQAQRDGSVEARQERARQMLRRKKNTPVEISNDTNLPLREVYRMLGEVRRERRA